MSWGTPMDQDLMSEVTQIKYIINKQLIDKESK